MKKMYVFLILGILLVSSLAIVYAAQGNGDKSYCEDSPCTDCVCKEGVKKVVPCVPPQNGGCNAQVCYECIKNKTEKNKTTFLPWQKRNESECLEGCKCVGAVMSCQTETGKTMTIQAGRSGNIITITIIKDGNETEVDTELEIETENETENGKNKTKLRAKLSNGRKAEIKIMPDVASERAIERLRLKVCNESNNCTIVLKEVPVGNNKTAAYELQAERHYRILALFKAKAIEKAQVNAETGEIIIVKKPWWAFLAKEE